MENDSPLIKLVNDYFDAFEDRDLLRCLEFYHDDAVVHFAIGKFPGIKSIEQWHADRFEGGMRIVEINSIEEQNDTVTVHAVATSPKLKLVKIDNFRGTATFVIQQGKFKEMRMGLLKGYRFHI